jgi:DNA-binding beta-propeller fold protein YncE
MQNSFVCSNRTSWLALSLAWSFTSIAFCADTNAVAVKQVLTGLKNPHGVAVRPDGSSESYEIFVAESGSGRVFKFIIGKPEKRIDVVSGFSTKSADKDNPTAAGAHSLQFLDHMRLVVAGGDDDGTPFVRLYELPEPESPLSSDQHKHEANVPETGKEPNFDAHVFRSIARTQANDRVGDFLLVAAPAESKSSGLVYVPIRSGTLGDAVPAHVKDAEGEFQIGGIAVGSNGYATMATNALGRSEQPSRLAYFNPLDRRIVMQLPTELSRIIALAYSSKSGNLFVVNAPTNDDGRAGIYRIDGVNQSGTSACTAAKIAEVRGPTALAFGPDGSLYVTATGDPKGKDAGALLKLTGDL